MAYNAVDFRNESADRSEMHRIAKVTSCDAHRAAEIACLLEIGIGGVKFPKIKGGGGENFEFPRAPEIDPFLQRFYRKSSVWASKVQVFEGQLSGRVPSSPPSVRYVLPPPPLSRSPSLVTSNSLGIARFTSWVAKAHRIADLHLAIW